jgi:hypothetical protein
MKRLIVLLLSGCAVAFGQDSAHSSTLTLGVGGLPYSDNANYPNLQSGGPTFHGNYEYRLSRYFAVEGGANILLPSGEFYSHTQVASLPAGQSLAYFNSANSSCIDCATLVSGRSRVTLLTYGLKGILPLANNRLELFGGLGGAYAWNSEFGGELNAAFAQLSLGGRFALDRRGRFWLGTTLRGFTSFGPGRQAWVPLTVDLGIRFGHR